MNISFIIECILIIIFLGFLLYSSKSSKKEEINEWDQTIAKLKEHNRKLKERNKEFKRFLEEISQEKK